MARSRSMVAVLNAQRKMDPGTMGGESRVATPAAPDWEVTVRGQPSCRTSTAVLTGYTHTGNGEASIVFTGITPNDFNVSLFYAGGG